MRMKSESVRRQTSPRAGRKLVTFCMHIKMKALLSSLMLIPSTIAFQHVPNQPYGFNRQCTHLMSRREENVFHRRSFLHTIKILSGVTTVSFVSTIGSPVQALVKGNAPPPPKKGTEERKCRNISECQELGERTAAQQEEEMKSQMLPPKVTTLGTRYRDMESADVQQLGSNVLVQPGNTASIRYKVLKIGKRSYDGLIGEGTVIFSRGYGLEDDENKPGESSFTFQVGDPSIVGALNDGILGMTIGSTRRIAVFPQMGWRRPGRECDGGPGGLGAGGELKTDYVVIPTATLVQEETCFDTTKKPFPTTFAQQRRMAQRFDQSLILEVQLVSVK